MLFRSEQKVSAHTLSKTFGSCQALFDAYCAGDILARETVSQFVLELSVVLANFIGLLNPERVILGGPVIEAMSGVIQEIRDTAFSLSPMHAVQFHASQVGPSSAREIYRSIREQIGRLRDFPLLGPLHPDPELAALGYRKLVLTKTYVAVYRQIGRASCRERVCQYV